LRLLAFFTGSLFFFVYFSHFAVHSPWMAVEDEVGYERMERPPELEFFDLRDDPYELIDVADEPAYAEPLGELKEALHAWRVATGDPLLEPGELERLRAEILGRE